MSSSQALKSRAAWRVPAIIGGVVVLAVPGSRPKSSANRTPAITRRTRSSRSSSGPRPANPIASFVTSPGSSRSAARQSTGSTSIAGLTSWVSRTPGGARSNSLRTQRSADSIRCPSRMARACGSVVYPYIRSAPGAGRGHHGREQPRGDLLARAVRNALPACGSPLADPRMPGPRHAEGGRRAPSSRRPIPRSSRTHRLRSPAPPRSDRRPRSRCAAGTPGHGGSSAGVQRWTKGVRGVVLGNRAACGRVTALQTTHVTGARGSGV